MYYYLLLKKLILKLHTKNKNIWFVYLHVNNTINWQQRTEHVNVLHYFKYTVGTESIQTPLNFSLFVILQPFAKII